MQIPGNTHAESTLNQRRIHAESMQTPAEPKQNQWRVHAEPEQKPCITDADSMQNP